MSSAPGSAPVYPDNDGGMGPIYVMVLVCHTLVISLLWLFGRVFSS